MADRDDQKFVDMAQQLLNEARQMPDREARIRLREKAADWLRRADSHPTE